MNHDPDPTERGLATEAVHAGGPERAPGSPVVRPVVHSSTYFWSDPGDGAEPIYTRLGSGSPVVRIPAGIRLSLTRTARSAFPAVIPDLMSACRDGWTCSGERRESGRTVFAAPFGAQGTSSIVLPTEP